MPDPYIRPLLISKSCGHGVGVFMDLCLFMPPSASTCRQYCREETGGARKPRRRQQPTPAGLSSKLPATEIQVGSQRSTYLGGWESIFGSTSCTCSVIISHQAGLSLHVNKVRVLRSAVVHPGMIFADMKGGQGGQLRKEPGLDG